MEKNWLLVRNLQSLSLLRTFFTFRATACKMLGITLVLFLASGCLAQVSYPEACPELETVPNFDLPRYMGTWYEAEKYPAQYEAGGKCVKAQYTLTENGTVLVENSQISNTTGSVSSIRGTGKPIGSLDVAKFIVTFSFGSYDREAPYWVIGTDYDTWSVVWSCRNVENASHRFAWILTRKQNPLDTELEKAYEVVDKNNISRAHFVRTNQKDCTTTS